MPTPADQIESMMQRADKLLLELSAIYTRDLGAKVVSLEALNVTHEIIEKCSNALDQAMTALFESDIKPRLSTLPKRGGYFPAADNDVSYRSTMGQWGVTRPEVSIPEVDKKLRALQPFANSANAIYSRIRSLASQKHSGLVPQSRIEQRRVNVTSPGGGGVSWGPGVTFGSGVRVMGVPIDPRTQMPAHTQGIDVKVETWVSFHLEGGGEDALAFCRQAIVATRRAVKALLSA